MKNLFYTILLIVGLFGCKSKNTDPTPVNPTPINTDPATIERKSTGTWTTLDKGAGGFNNYESFKNFQYTFEVLTNNQTVDMTLSSSVIDLQYAIFNPLGQLIAYSTSASRSRLLTKSLTLNAGIYRLTICADRNAIGDFSLTLKGIKANPVRIPSKILQSNTQTWGDLGGGGLGYYKSFKNHYYTFDVTEENSSIDVELLSTDTEVALVLYDELGTEIERKNGDRYHYIIEKLKKGTYSLMAGTNKKRSMGNYQLNLVGKLDKLVKVPSNTSSVTGYWPQNSSFDTYSLEINESNSTLDLELMSADTYVSMDLQTSVGTSIDLSNPYNKNTTTIISESLPKGTYRIVVEPYTYFSKGGFGNYSLNVVGQFKNFKKL